MKKVIVNNAILANFLCLQGRGAYLDFRDIITHQSKTLDYFNKVNNFLVCMGEIETSQESDLVSAVIVIKKNSSSFKLIKELLTPVNYSENDLVDGEVELRFFFYGLADELGMASLEYLPQITSKIISLLRTLLVDLRI